MTIPGTNIRVFDYGAANSIDDRGRQAIRDVFGFDPSRGEAAAYTYGNGYQDPEVRNQTGFSGGTYRDPQSGARAAYVFADRANDEARRYGIRNGEGLVATQEVAQRFVSMEVSRPQQEIIGDAVSVAYDGNYSFKTFQLAAVNHFDTLDSNYRATANVGKQAIGVLMDNYGLGTGSYMDRGAQFLNDFGDYITKKNIPPTTDAFSEQNLRGFATEVLKRNPDRFIADFKEANVVTYRAAAQQVLKQYNPTAP